MLFEAKHHQSSRHNPCAVRPETQKVPPSGGWHLPAVSGRGRSVPARGSGPRDSGRNLLKSRLWLLVGKVPPFFRNPFVRKGPPILRSRCRRKVPPGFQQAGRCRRKVPPGFQQAFGREKDLQPDSSMRLWHGVAIPIFLQIAGPLALTAFYWLYNQPVGLG